MRTQYDFALIHELILFDLFSLVLFLSSFFFLFLFFFMKIAVMLNYGGFIPVLRFMD
jgi:hypothetical protein